MQNESFMSRYDTLKKMLLDEKREILGRLRIGREESSISEQRMSFENAQDNADRSVDELLKHVDVQVAGARAEVLDLIDDALARLDEGAYGICDECGCDIPEERLRVLPFVTRCVHCQEGADRLKKIQSAGSGGSVPESTPEGSMTEDERP